MQCKFLVKTILLGFAIVFSSPLLAKHLMPIFSGFWYSQPKEIAVDNCGLGHFEYIYPQTKDPETLARVLLQNMPPRDFCMWDDTHLISIDKTEEPYPFTGNSSDWQKIMSTSGPFVQTWGRACKTSYGRVAEQKTVRIEPQYICPENTRSANDHDDDYVWGCSTQPFLCYGDVVGRDLQIPAAAGHVGLTVRASSYTKFHDMVLEVLWQDQVLQFNTFDSFRLATVYWGNKYALSGIPFITDDQGDGISNVSSSQYKCKKMSYTLGWDWHPCQTDPGTGEESAVFRCDSYVYYSYLQGAKIKILDYSSPVLPTNLFARFLNYRCDGYEKRCDVDGWKTSDNSQNQANLIHKTWRQKVVKAISSLDRYFAEKSVEDIFLQPIFNLGNADRVTRYYIKNAGIARKDKISFLWNLAQEYRSDETRFNYVMSCLRSLQPIELTDYLISEFNWQSSIKNKIVLMQVLEEMVYKRAKRTYFEIDPSLSNIANASLPKIYNFYQDLLLHDENIEILKEAILTYPVIFSPDQAKRAIDRTLQRADIIDLKKELLMRHEFYAGQLAMIFSSSMMQKQYLEIFLNEMGQQETDIKKIFNDVLYSYFADEDFYSPEIGFDSSKIDDAVRLCLMQYLEKQKPRSFKVDHYPESSFLSIDGERYRWLETYIATQSRNIAEKNQKLASYIKEISDLYYQSSLLSCATANVYAQFTTEEISKLEVLLSDQITILRKIPINASKETCIAIDMKRMFLEKAISKLNQVLRTRNKR